MIWSLYAMLGQNMWWTDNPELDFDDEAWDKLLDAAHKNGFNQIVLDIGEGIEFASHPELAKKGAWTRSRVRKEIKRCRDLGIELIPKLNFSATHHMWLGEYRRMMSTPTYYRVCRDLIYEVADLFEHPTYIHIGMDEEGDAQFFKNLDMVHYRHGELIWHDLQFLCDCVTDKGSTPWIWGDLCVWHPEEFRAHVTNENIVLSPWIYYAVRPEHWTPVASKQRYIDAVAGEDVEYMEQAHFWVTMTNEGVRAMNEGFKTVPCCSLWGENDWCTDDVLEHYLAKDEGGNMIGYMTAPWVTTNNAKIDYIIESMEKVAAAREKFYKG